MIQRYWFLVIATFMFFLVRDLITIRYDAMVDLHTIFFVMSQHVGDDGASQRPRTIILVRCDSTQIKCQVILRCHAVAHQNYLIDVLILTVPTIRAGILMLGLRKSSTTKRTTTTYSAPLIDTLEMK